MNDNEENVITLDSPINAPGSPFDGVTGFVRYYDWQKYAYWRVVTLFRENYGLEIEKHWQGYKANRRPGYQELYQLRDITTGEVIVPLTSMKKMQQFLAHEGYPLYAPKVKRNPGCVAFLEAVANAAQEGGEDNAE